ncbi:MAG: acyl-[acyl-carrier-protein]--UDP-N-acetylglucosamine O-acyltransferase [Alphaproteobacteria bacterium 16-39-46]|nr:MAG: acyl-[acyl-carrier-protein]--UDP-N-acetylglucosamine O-acyltransferase [Alphaproteobacteria bacterium 16-39-46]OZA43369.1 MAG: acyl-[acyl-carrier-protein]--UDP-N-acetylglucosamine O-acyltransferase [Alphaproteobacteria bacterium 17-39-52]HQS83908.1 acyl-ACP--UDP-N-acetylglucosamine O-acyltransferase [Alphaproteobacteria bacterium]HQS93826.1 acyl-ACP--UDP-N-acetylglucosamine O-acyltransferase [Alphaproteobacteria bacterium]
MTNASKHSFSFLHPTALVEEGAHLGKNVSIGPFCSVSKDVILEDNVVLHSNVVIQGKTHLGKNVEVFPFAVLGGAPQSLRLTYERSQHGIIIGDNTIIREHVTIHPGTAQGGGETRIGHDCFIMVAAHIAHDCKLGDHVIMANNATLGGHVTIGDYANIGGLSAVHQYVRIGKHAMIGGMSGVENDVIPYGSVMGDRARLSGLNVIGLKRRGFSRESIHSLRSAYRLLFAQEGTMAERILDVSTLFKDHEIVMEILSFMQSETDRSICLPKSAT